jgi:hypothetical protein
MPPVMLRVWGRGYRMQHSRPITAPICATSRTDASRSSRAISESCKLVGIAKVWLADSDEVAR